MINNDKILVKNNFTCSKCGKKIPHVVLAIDKGVPICNYCDVALFNKMYCNNTDSDAENELRILEIAENQIKLLIRELRKRVKGKIEFINEIIAYWAHKTNGLLKLSDGEAKSVEGFLIDFNIDEIQEAIDIAFSKNKIDDNARFKYLCGILTTKRKQRVHSPSYAEVVKYWNYKRPQKWKKADEGKVEHVLSKYDVKKIKYYIDRIIDEDKGWTDFDDVIEALDENRFD